MASNVSSVLSNALSCSSKKSERRTITKDNVTTYDVYVQCRYLEKLIKTIEKKMEANPAQSFRVELNEYPFELPLSSIDAVESCERFIQTTENYQMLVRKNFYAIFNLLNN